MHHGDQNRVRPQCGRHLAGGNSASGIRFEEGDFEPLPGQEFERLQDGLVFDGRGNDVASSGFFGMLPHAQDREIVALGGAACENDVLTLGFDHRRDLVARALDGLLGAIAVFVCAATGIAKLLANEKEEVFLDLGVNRSGGVAIEVNGHRRMLIKNVC